MARSASTVPAMDAFGTTGWAAAGGGRLTAGERVLEVARGLGQLARDELGRLIGLRPPELALALAEVERPRTPLADAALRRLEATPAWNVGHSMRSWLFGALLARRDGVAFDAELAFVAAALHDLGLVGDGSEACFAHRGAELARRLCLATGASEARAATVADAICQHLDVDAAPTGEARVVRFGSGLDVVGARFFELSPTTRRAVVQAWPRGEFARDVTAALEREAQRHPETRVGLLCGALRFPHLIARAERRFAEDARRGAHAPPDGSHPWS